VTRARDKRTRHEHETRARDTSRGREHETRARDASRGHEHETRAGDTSTRREHETRARDTSTRHEHETRIRDAGGDRRRRGRSRNTGGDPLGMPAGRAGPILGAPARTWPGDPRTRGAGWTATALPEGDRAPGGAAGSTRGSAPACGCSSRSRSPPPIKAEADPRAAGLSPAAVRAVWDAVVRCYRAGLHPALSTSLRRRGVVVLERAIGHARGNHPGAHAPP